MRGRLPSEVPVKTALLCSLDPSIRRSAGLLPYNRQVLPPPTMTRARRCTERPVTERAEACPEMNHPPSISAFSPSTKGVTCERDRQKRSIQAARVADGLRPRCEGVRAAAIPRRSPHRQAVDQADPSDRDRDWSLCWCRPPLRPTWPRRSSGRRRSCRSALTRCRCCRIAMSATRWSAAPTTTTTWERRNRFSTAPCFGGACSGASSPNSSDNRRALKRRSWPIASRLKKIDKSELFELAYLAPTRPSPRPS